MVLDSQRLAYKSSVSVRVQSGSGTSSELLLDVDEMEGGLETEQDNNKNNNKVESRSEGKLLPLDMLQNTQVQQREGCELCCADSWLPANVVMMDVLSKGRVVVNSVHGN